MSCLETQNPFSLLVDSHYSGMVGTAGAAAVDAFAVAVGVASLAVDGSSAVEADD